MSAVSSDDLLGLILSGRAPAFAILSRPESTGSDSLEVMVGDITHPATLADIPMPQSAISGNAGHGTLALVPFRQISERGYECKDDRTPLVAMSVTSSQTVSLAEVRERIADLPIRLSGGHFDIDDEGYADTVRRVIAEEVGEGEGSNFVIKRSFVTEIDDYAVDRALTLFRRLLEQESGAYWTFIVHTGERTLVGATPERHISVRGGKAVMNPISGTYRYPTSGPRLSEVMEFLSDRKEADELYMVVDEELKMMANVCDDGGRVVGPFLREMARLAHTEYLIEGHTSRDAREILFETMFAPTVTGSPLQNACRVIARHEPHGRGYYGGILALLGRDEHGRASLDSSILIRTADIDGAGRLSIGVGATLVRNSDPMSEVAETRAKTAGLVAALESGRPTAFANHPDVQTALGRRNDTLSEFWLADVGAPAAQDQDLTGRRVLVVDAEDAFVSMISQQLRSLRLDVTVQRFDEPVSFDAFDLVVMGPGPGDPRDQQHPKIRCMDDKMSELLASRVPFLAVCLSHQILSRKLGLDVVRRDIPNQGTQKTIDLFGTVERVGFYNTFTARSAEDVIVCDAEGAVEISRDRTTGEVHALRGSNFASVQFHAESVLTQGGLRITRDLLCGVLADRTSAPALPAFQ